MAIIGYVQIEPTFSGVQSKIESEMGAAGESSGKSFGSGFGKVLSGAGGALGKAGALVAGAAAVGGSAIVAMGGKLVSATADVASYGDNIDKMSQKMGLSAEAYQEWDAVMQHSGTSMETMKSSMKTLANAAESGNKAFEALGITQEQVASMSQQDLFEATIAGLQNVEDTTQRTYLAGQLLGRGATELGALLNTSAEDTQAMRDRVKELGGVMSDDAVKAAAAYQDQLQDMQTAFSGLSRNLTAEFLPSMTTVMSGLTEIFSGNSDQGIAMITEGISGIMDGLTQALPQIMQVATGIIEALATAIIENLPQLAQTGIDIVVQLGTFIIENLPMLIETAAQVILELAMGIAQALPELIPTIVEVVLTIAQYLIENIDLLIDAATQLMIGLTLGLIQALPILIEKAPVIITSLLTALLQAIPKLIEAGKQIINIIKDAVTTYGPVLYAKGQALITDLKTKIMEKVKGFLDVGKNIVEGIKKGISDAWESLTSWFSEKIGALVDGVKDFLKIGSPSKVFAEDIGQWIPAGIAQGIEDGMGVLDKAIDGMSTNVLAQGINATVSSVMDAADTGAGSSEDLYTLLAQTLPRILDLLAEDKSIQIDGQEVFRSMQRQARRNTQLVGPGAVLSST